MSDPVKNTGIIIQARSGSTRMPDKMLKPFFSGKSILEILIDRFKKEAGGIPFVIATTTVPSDDRIEDMAKRANSLVFRGSEENVLQRFIDTAGEFGFEKIIRVCADNPLFDISGTLKLLDFDKISDYAAYKMTNNKPSITTHSGFWGELVTVEALKKINQLTDERIYLEHVTNFIYSNPDLFKIKLLPADAEVFYRDDIRLTVDTKEDFKMVSQIYSLLSEQNQDISVANVLKIIESKPDFLKMMATQIKLNSK